MGFICKLYVLMNGWFLGYPAMYGMMPTAGGTAPPPPPPYGYTAFYGPYPAAPSMNGQDNNGPHSPPALFRQHAHQQQQQQQPMFAYSYQPGISGAAVSDTSAVYPHSPPTPMAMYYPYPQQQPYFIPSTAMQGFVSASASSTSSSNQSASSISNNTTPTCEQGPSNNKPATAAVHQMAVPEIPT
ncbi:hypothetical protein K492DRAFT_28772 [Lichtheimia hyalospora FSU 10163]|nr:hypothetical protein K492DRAFT_28772 [Lichtheimia hyalospora FSU 10163]